MNQNEYLNAPGQQNYSGQYNPSLQQGQMQGNSGYGQQYQQPYTPYPNQQYYGQYPQVIYVEKQYPTGMAHASAACGVIGLLTCFIPLFFPIILSVMAVILGLKVLFSTRQGGKGYAVLGCILGGIALLPSLSLLYVYLATNY